MDTLAGVALASDMNTFTLDSDAAVRLLAAALLGGLVGIEREVSDQAAGLRTHIAVALGASLFGIISTLGFLEFDQTRADSTIQADVSRVASNVVVGIGFLGAGVIFRQGNTIRNLTTAASLWAVAAIGLACGVGDIATAAAAAVVLLGSLVLLRPVRTYMHRRWGTRSVTVEVVLHPHADPSAVIDALDAGDVETSRFAVHKRDGQVVLATDASGRPGLVHRWIAEMTALDGVERIDET
ncbi:MAG TPA: MgtC/SapB family protein [Acidimicrobiales bacterium]|nr:MgtC/SapB family protein [Acidimicrobiales bacterium]